MCASLNLASTISANALHLSAPLIARMLTHATVLLSDEHASVASIDAACARSALAVMANTLAASNASSLGGDGFDGQNSLAALVSSVEANLASILRETAGPVSGDAGMVNGESISTSSNASAASITRNLGGRAWAAASLPTHNL